MNYKLRDTVLGRWCFFALIASFGILLGDYWTNHVELLNSPSRIWIIPQIMPNWLVLPITNVLFVLTFVWMKTNFLTLNPYWYQSRRNRYLLAVLQAILISSFCEAYSLPTLIIYSLLVWSFIAYYFGDTIVIAIGREDYDIFEHIRYSDDDHACSSSYSYGAFMLYFHTLIIIYSLNVVLPNMSWSGNWSSFLISPPLKETLMILFGTPLLYLLGSAIIVFGLCLLIPFTYGLWWLLKRIIKLFLWAVCCILIALCAVLFWSINTLEASLYYLKDSLYEAIDYFLPSRS